ncbi:Dual specificity protein kinase lkh1 [Neolecta irregularis DAH-3]|uniref:Dual specificity protein kinase lkh1 n=1 Tax=Neolecta irregularis (strain DAH-3) TaxID=1198029 RepID=A0A1U7LSP3_NEOID|nr:Dual specificity protein kinase lkh1 [Neolecta irregularis DAH-3]|eukprot:OLL25696.1 Dual specificity protein kinase lkh1 [Neolecta irregularis DAH-3]
MSMAASTHARPAVASPSASSSASSTKRRRAVDWDSFYRNGRPHPHEVIVLDADLDNNNSPPPPSRKRKLPRPPVPPLPPSKRRKHDKVRDVFVEQIPDVNVSLALDSADQATTSLSQTNKIVQQLGQGTFGKVVQCLDLRANKLVAIKVIRSVQKYRDASRIELRVLDTLRQHDPLNEHNCIHFIACFDYRNHICIVTEMLGMSLFDFLKENKFAPFPAKHIQQFSKQLFSSVSFLHGLNLIHTDLKPENILLVRNEYRRLPYNGRSNITDRRVLDYTDIRLIDFGSATFNDEYHSSVVSTRHYRAPEIILGSGWAFPCDVWSIGCILLEFYTGDALFQTHDNLEHLAMMEAFAGRFDERSIRSARVVANLDKNSFVMDVWIIPPVKLAGPAESTSKA